MTQETPPQTCSVLLVGNNSEEIQRLSSLLRDDGYALLHRPGPPLDNLGDFSPQLYLFTSDLTADTIRSCFSSFGEERRHLCVVPPGGWKEIAALQPLAAWSHDASPPEILFRLKEALSCFQLHQTAQLRLQKLNLTRSRMELLTSVDLVTGLNNRARFLQNLEETLARSLRYKRPFCCLIGRVESYEELRRRWGAEVMDDTLEDLAGLLETVLRDADMLARVNADQFGLILQETDLSKAQRVTERIQESMTLIPFRHDVEDLSLSFGVVTLNDPAQTPEDILHAAQDALPPPPNSPPPPT